MKMNFTCENAFRLALILMNRGSSFVFYNKINKFFSIFFKNKAHFQEESLFPKNHAFSKISHIYNLLKFNIIFEMFENFY